MENEKNPQPSSSPSPGAGEGLRWLLIWAAAYILALQLMFVGAHFDENGSGSLASRLRPDPRTPLGFVAQVPFYFLELLAGMAGLWSQVVRGACPEKWRLFGFLALWIWLARSATTPTSFLREQVFSESTMTAVAVFAMFEYIYRRVFTWTDHANHLVSVATSPILDLPLMIVMVIVVVGAGVTLWKRNPVVWNALRAMSAGVMLFAPYLFTDALAPGGQPRRLWHTETRTSAWPWPWEIWRQALEEMLRAAVPASVVAPFHWAQEPSRLAGFSTGALLLASLVRIATTEDKWMRTDVLRSRAWIAAHFGGLFLSAFLVSGGRHILSGIGSPQ